MEIDEPNPDSKAFKLKLWAAAALAITGIIMALAVRDDTLTTDETLYLPTGYLYLTEHNSRIGFEHPPLVRDMAAIPLLFMDLKPASQFWDPKVEGAKLNDEVWSFGDKFMHGQRIHSHEILFWGRLPIILLTMILGLLVFRVTEINWGDDAALLSLFMFALSPFILAHGRLVTTDVPTALGALVSILAFTSFLKEPKPSRIVLFGAALAFALLIKFALFTLVPFLALSTFVWAALNVKPSQPFRGVILRYAVPFGGALLVSLVLISIVYEAHIWNYPSIQQYQDIVLVLNGTRGNLSVSELLLTLADFSLTRPLAQYFLGMTWQFSRTGAFGYFNGEGSFTSWPGFYPFGYFAKQPIAFHILTIIALWVFGTKLKKIWMKAGDNLAKTKKLLREHLFVSLSLAWIAYYAFILIFINKGNTGSRYLLPLLPFIFILASAGVSSWMRGGKNYFRKAAVAVLLLFQAVSVHSIYPSYLAYFNEAVGGPENGGRYLVDTDLDWGQDVKRLADWVKNRSIPGLKLAQSVEVSAGGTYRSTEMVYTGAYAEYLGQYEVLKPGVVTQGWIALPARLLFWGNATAAKKLGWSSESYRWLRSYKPVARIGYSIYVYDIQ